MSRATTTSSAPPPSADYGSCAHPTHFLPKAPVLTGRVARVGKHNLTPEPLTKAERASARLKRRQAKPPRANLGLSYLEEESVGEITQEDYRVRYQALMAWFQLARLPSKTLAQLDAGLVNLLHEMYFEGAEAADGNKMLAALAHFHHLVTRGAKSLSRAHKCMRGW